MQEVKNSTTRKNHIKVNIHIGAHFGGNKKRQETLEIVDGATAGMVIRELLERSLIQLQEDKKENDIERFVDSIVILINGKNMRYLDGMNTVISDNDAIIILKPLVGG